MKANELRIGNYIFGCYETESERENEESQELDVLCKFIGYDPFEKYLWVEAIDGVDYEFSNFNPIPLTEEWLLKFGFKERKNSIPYRYYKNRHSIELFSNYARMNYSIGFKYVHQLQNLYFALYGEELTIKEIKPE